MDSSDKIADPVKTETNEPSVSETPIARSRSSVSSWLPVGAICRKCGDGRVSSVPAFTVGSGTATQPWADDVICARCGHIGVYAMRQPQ